MRVELSNAKRRYRKCCTQKEVFKMILNIEELLEKYVSYGDTNKTLWD